MDEKAAKRIEQKIDYIAGLVMGSFGAGVGIAIIYTESWGSWSSWGGGLVGVILPAYLISVYRDI